MWRASLTVGTRGHRPQMDSPVFRGCPPVLLDTGAERVYHISMEPQHTTLLVTETKPGLFAIRSSDGHTTKIIARDITRVLVPQIVHAEERDAKGNGSDVLVVVNTPGATP